MKLLIVDTNNNLIEECKKAGYDAICGDYFLTANKTQNHVLCTASNPQFTFGGGIDALFWDKFNGYCQYKQTIGGDMQRIGNICFLITVSNNYRANKEIIKTAMQFARWNTNADETLLLSGIGIGIGGLFTKEYIECLDTVFKIK